MRIKVTIEFLGTYPESAKNVCGKKMEKSLLSETIDYRCQNPRFEF